MKYIIRLGEPIVLALKIESGSSSIVTGVLAKVKKAAPGGQVPPVTDASLGTLTSVYDAAIPGWRLTLADTTGLGVGSYVVDARLSVTGYGSLYTDPIFVDVKAHVSS